MTWTGKVLHDATTIVVTVLMVPVAAIDITVRTVDDAWRWVMGPRPAWRRRGNE